MKTFINAVTLIAIFICLMVLVLIPMSLLGGLLMVLPGWAAGVIILALVVSWAWSSFLAALVFTVYLTEGGWHR